MQARIYERLSWLRILILEYLKFKLDPPTPPPPPPPPPPPNTKLSSYATALASGFALRLSLFTAINPWHPCYNHYQGRRQGGFEGVRTNPPFDRLVSNTHFLQGLACMACHAPAPTIHCLSSPISNNAPRMTTTTTLLLT